MSKTESQFLADYAHIVEKIVFDQDELEKLKTTVKNLTEGKIGPKELKGLILQCRGRIVGEITEYLLFIGRKIVSDNFKERIPPPSASPPTPPSQIEAQLREEIKEKNELLEIVAIRINQLVSKFDDSETVEDQSSIPIENVKEEVERCLNQIGVKEWIDMCFYEDYKFFVKLYPKLESLYEEKFSQDNEDKEGKKIMANKMAELGFPEDIETIVIKYISVRNTFQHSMTDISPSNLELAREVFVNVLIYLIVSNLEPTFLLNNRETIQTNLTKYFSKRLTGNPPFRNQILVRVETIFTT